MAKLKIYLTGDEDACKKVIEQIKLIKPLEVSSYKMRFKEFAKSNFNVALRDDLALFTQKLAPEVQQKKALDYMQGEVIIIAVRPELQSVKKWGMTADLVIKSTTVDYIEDLKQLINN